MALTKSDVPELLVPGLKTQFETAYRAELDNDIAGRLATVINTTLPSQTYAWLGATPPMREWIDERRPQGMAKHAVTIEDKTFESSIAVDRRALEDDQLDLIRLRVQDLASRVATHRHQVVVEALAGGDTATAYDGENFFDTDHPAGSGTYSNTTSDSLGASSLADGMEAMMTLPDESDTPLGIAPDVLLVGPAQMWNAIELADSPVVVSKGTASEGTPPTDYVNAFQGRLKVIVSPFLRGADADKWFLLDTKRAIKGIVLQQRSDVPVEFTALEADSGSESAWFRDRYHYGVRARYNVGYGLWQAAYGGGF